MKVKVKENLKSFLGKYNVEIPMLQRDYAQGRKSKENIAKNFLEKIFEVLKDKNKKLHIDFIYGYEENNKFILVDGQQRITTLWLIYFIIYKMNDIFDDNIKNLLNKFSYSVRESSEIFCKNLIKEELNLNGNPKEIILGKGGIFGQDLDIDPTIKAMLNMLNLIYSEAKKLNQNELKNAADNLDNITFSIFDMGEYELGEELYIKMNARGKQLSKYENVKAYIQKGLKFEENFKLFSSIDNEWSDFFFDAKNKNTDNFDNRGLIFLYYSALFFHFDYNKEIEDKELDNYLNKKVSEDSEDSIDYKFFDILKASEKLRILDNTIKILNKYKKEIPLKDFVKKFNSDLSRKDICYFCALLSFVSKIKDTDSFDKNAFDDYYRVCKHFIENYSFNYNKEVKNFFELSNNRLSEGYNDIYKYLSEDNKKALNFHTEFYKLEKEKAKLIIKSRENKNSKNKENWEEILNKTSDNDFLVGWVNFLLDFSNKNFDKFKKYAELTIDITDKLNDTEFLNLFQRALLTFGDYGFHGFKTANYFYGNIPQINITDRRAWIRILSGTNKDGEIINKCFKELLDNLLKQNSGTLKKQLNSIIKKVNIKDKKWFEYLLIKEPQLFDFINEKGGDFKHCGRIKYFDRRGYKDMALLQTVQAERDSVDLLTYSFYLYIKKKKIEPGKFKYKKLKHNKYGDKRNKNSYFKINNKEVICDSINEEIKIGNKKYNINLHKKGTDIFEEFDNILEESNIIK